MRRQGGRTGSARMRAGRPAAALAAAAVALAGWPGGAAAEALRFDRGWKEQGFLRLWSNEYRAEGTRLEVVSDGTVSMFYAPLERRFQDAERASWEWSVSRSVVPTPLHVKGADDRNLALYFVFLPPERAEALSPRAARRLLRDGTARMVVYVWGGNHARGARLISPYGAEGSLGLVVLRQAGTGRFSEQVAPRNDFERLFGRPAGRLVALAVSADSDDTGGQVRGVIENLRLE